MNEMGDRWLSITKICKHLGVSNDTVYKWLDKNLVVDVGAGATDPPGITGWPSYDRAMRKAAASWGLAWGVTKSKVLERQKMKQMKVFAGKWLSSHNLKYERSLFGGCCYA
ncbi:MAG: hypothetical protein LLF99_04040 [Desulfobacteraceae bacterium]|nr:hypothetical protein [Desulfobacteraceae bacterium]